MKPLTKNLIIALAGMVGGVLGMVISFFVFSFVLSFSPLIIFLGLFGVGLCPLVGAFASMGAATLTGRFLDRFD